MTQPLDVIDLCGPDEFVARHLAPARPVVVRGLDYDRAAWTPASLRARAGELATLVYGALFDLEDVSTLADYLDDWFADPGRPGSTGTPGSTGATAGSIAGAAGSTGAGAGPPVLEPGEDVPYVRWYNRLRDVEAAWGDEALARMADTWRAPACLPVTDLVVPARGPAPAPDPVVDPFPYRGLLVAARGARTRLHRDPFGTDAVVCQFAGEKEAALYHPDRSAELSVGGDTTSYGGFLDVRGEGLDRLLVEPDFHGTVGPGEMIYIPRGWLHDVVAVTDSLSVTWNFVHAAGRDALDRYLRSNPEADSELEILRYFAPDGPAAL